MRLFLRVLLLVFIILGLCSLAYAYTGGLGVLKRLAFWSKPSRHALLLFGKDGRLQIRVALDGETLFLDRDGDGKFSGNGERFAKIGDCKDVAIPDPDGQTRYVITHIGNYEDKGEQHLMVNVDIQGPLAYRQYCDLAMRDLPSRAAVAHFHGPLTAGPATILWKVPPKLALASGEKPTDLPVVVGTMSAEQGCWVVVCSHQGTKYAFAEGVHPAVDVEFPAKTPGGLPVKRRYVLDKFC